MTAANLKVVLDAIKSINNLADPKLRPVALAVVNAGLPVPNTVRQALQVHNVGGLGAILNGHVNNDELEISNLEATQIQCAAAFKFIELLAASNPPVNAPAGELQLAGPLAVVHATYATAKAADLATLLATQNDNDFRAALAHAQRGSRFGNLASVQGWAAANALTAPVISALRQEAGNAIVRKSIVERANQDDLVALITAGARPLATRARDFRTALAHADRGARFESINNSHGWDVAQPNIIQDDIITSLVNLAAYQLIAQKIKDLKPAEADHFNLLLQLATVNGGAHAEENFRVAIRDAGGQAGAVANYFKLGGPLSVHANRVSNESVISVKDAQQLRNLAAQKLLAHKIDALNPSDPDQLRILTTLAAATNGDEFRQAVKEGRPAGAAPPAVDHFGLAAALNGANATNNVIIHNDHVNQLRNKAVRKLLEHKIKALNPSDANDAALLDRLGHAGALNAQAFRQIIRDAGPAFGLAATFAAAGRLQNNDVLHEDDAKALSKIARERVHGNKWQAINDGRLVQGVAERAVKGGAQEEAAAKAHLDQGKLLESEFRQVVQAVIQVDDPTAAVTPDNTPVEEKAERAEHKATLLDKQGKLERRHITKNSAEWSYSTTTKFSSEPKKHLFEMFYRMAMGVKEEFRIKGKDVTVHDVHLEKVNPDGSEAICREAFEKAGFRNLSIDNEASFVLRMN